MPTAYLKKLAKLNKISVNKLEKFWAQAKEIAKSEGQGNSWGLITSIFQTKLKKEGYKIEASTAQNKIDYINQVKECIKQIFARGTRNQKEHFAKEWVANYSRIIDDCLNAFEEPKVCARMMYIKYHRENPQTRDLNKNKDTDFHTLLKEAKQYVEGLKKFQEECGLLNELENKQVTSSAEIHSYKYHSEIITASSKQEAIQQIISKSN